MRILAYEEIAWDTLKIARLFGCNLDARVTLGVMEYVADHYVPGLELDFETILDCGLDLHEPLTDEQRHAYKYLLGTIYYERQLRAKRNMQAAYREMPFAPR